jgi:hypothetical protein
MVINNQDRMRMQERGTGRGERGGLRGWAGGLGGPEAGPIG